MNETIALWIAGLGVGIVGWSLIEIIRLKIEIAKFSEQLGRIVSDIESEKGTRKRLHDDYERRLRRLELKLPITE